MWHEGIRMRFKKTTTKNNSRFLFQLSYPSKQYGHWDQAVMALTIIQKGSMLSNSHGLSLNHDPENKALCHVPMYDTWRHSTTNQPCASGRSRCLGTSTASWENRRRLKTTCMQWQTVSPRYQDMTSGLARWGGDVVVTFFPGLRTWWWREFMMLLEHYCVFCPFFNPF